MSSCTAKRILVQRQVIFIIKSIFIVYTLGAPKFTKEPQNPSLVVEGDNITLEWEYTFGESESFFS